MEVYDRVIKIVAPKRAKLQEAEVELSRQMKRLSEKHTQLQQVGLTFDLVVINFTSSIKMIENNLCQSLKSFYKLVKKFFKSSAY